MAMTGKDVIKGSMATCWVKIGDNRYDFAHAITLEATMEKNKSTVPVLGKTGQVNISSGWSGSGTMTMHYNTSIMRDMLATYKDTGEDVYFEIQVKNEAPGSTVGNQIVTLKECTIDGGVIAKFDADADYLDEDVDFTFDDFEIGQKFLEPKLV